MQQQTVFFWQTAALDLYVAGCGCSHELACASHDAQCFNITSWLGPGALASGAG